MANQPAELQAALPQDVDPEETREWQEALDGGFL